MAAEGIAGAVPGLEVPGVGEQDRLLDVLVGQLLGHQELAGREDDAVGGGAGQLDEPLVADAVAVEQRRLDAEVGVVPGGDGG